VNHEDSLHPEIGRPVYKAVLPITDALINALLEVVFIFILLNKYYLKTEDGAL